MKNKPNMYRVNYLILEGDNYAGGWVKRSADVSDLGDVSHFNNVDSVMPIFVEIGDPVDDVMIQEAIDARRQAEEEKRRRVKVARLEKLLTEARVI